MSSFTDKGLKISKNVLFNVFIGRATKLLGTPFKVVTILNEAADKLADKGSKTNKFRQLFDVALTLVRMVRSFISGDYRDISKSTVVTGLAVLLYVLSPIDLVPDFIPVVGFLDDLSLIGWFMGHFSTEITRFRTWEALAGASLPSSAQPLLSPTKPPNPPWATPSSPALRSWAIPRKRHGRQGLNKGPGPRQFLFIVRENRCICKYRRAACTPLQHISNSTQAG
ncbi:hypothetical protein BEN47_16225 [Hymenobacter lapidarius]|uniref:DUF1232 domain-containing protein n=1 Tax=Hymenobacter lapidarius TaxID=1908237 RepID=A0A1G1T0Z1_9BACT|nr:YkvA family protein [Hymenobacter lapidarius]OGX84496.1 hypothetical protein BEN47_16225 [Hymenobacter lapidarius]